MLLIFDRFGLRRRVGSCGGLWAHRIVNSFKDVLLGVSHLPVATNTLMLLSDISGTRRMLLLLKIDS